MPAWLVAGRCCGLFRTRQTRDEHLLPTDYINKTGEVSAVNDMRLSPRELDKLVTYQTGSLAQRRLARGLQLNLTEANALIAFQLQELIRDGKHSVSELMQLGKEILSRRHVLPGVSALMHDVQVEGTFPDGCVSQILWCLIRFHLYSEIHAVACSWSPCMILFVQTT